MPTHDLLSDVEPEPGAARQAARGVGADERLEQPCLLLRRDADALVGHAQHRLRALTPHTDPHSQPAMQYFSAFESRLVST